MELFTDAAKNLYRRKFRTLLAIIGVGTGVFSFLTMGSLAEHFNRLSFTFNRLFENRVFISEKPSFWAGGGILSISKAEKAGKVDGVKRAAPVLITRRDSDALMVIGIPQMVVGVSPENLDLLTGGYSTLSGKAELSEKGTALLGSDVAFGDRLSTGDEILIENRRFKVAGVFGKTGGIIDSQLFIPLSDAQEIYDRQGLITSVIILPDAGVDPELLGEALKKQVSGVQVIPPSRFRAQVDKSLTMWNAITLGASFVAVAAGILCVVIVMLSSVSERTVEIGIKKSLGAEDFHIMAEFLAESVLVCIPGWLFGFLSALVFTQTAGHHLSSLGTVLFEITPRLALASFGGVILLGVLSGIPPAWRAAVIEPVTAMKPRY